MTKILIIVFMFGMIYYYFESDYSKNKLEINLVEKNITENKNVNSTEENISLKYLDTVFPVEKYSISSGFGPRLKASDDYRYDFHRGIDIHGEKGDNVFSIANGEVFRIYQEGEKGTPYPSGGTTIVLRHNLNKPIIFHGKEFTKLYSIYMHMDSVSDILVKNTTNKFPYYKVKKGDIIGKLGQSGDTTFNHVHFETRVGTTCSREFQLKNPSNSCYNVIPNNGDPHINPYVFLEYNDTENQYIKILSLSPLKINISGNKDSLDFNYIRLENKGITKEIDFNERVGIDNSNIDNNDYNGVIITPDKFNSSVEKYSINFEFTNINGYEKIEIKDILGNKYSIKK